MKMLEKILGRKTEMVNMMVYWPDNVNMDDFMEDYNRIKSYVNGNDTVENGNKIVRLYEERYYNQTIKYKVAELQVSDNVRKMIMNDEIYSRFKGNPFVFRKAV